MDATLWQPGTEEDDGSAAVVLGLAQSWTLAKVAVHKEAGSAVWFRGRLAKTGGILEPMSHEVYECPSPSAEGVDEGFGRVSPQPEFVPMH